MKKFKKVFTVLLTLAMVLGMCITSSAAPNNSKKPTESDTALATVSNVEAGATVTAYRIVVPKYNNNGFIGYEVAKDSNGKDLVTLGNPLAPTSDEVTSIAHDDDLLNSLDKISLLAEEGSTTYTAQLGAGYWVVLVTGSNIQKIYNPMLVGVYYDTTGSGDNNILTNGAVDATKNWTLGSTPAYVKSQLPTIDKKIVSSDGNGSGNDVAIGDTVNFEIDTVIPSYSKSYTKVEVKITDTLSKGLTLPGDINVKVNGRDVTESEDTYTFTSDAQTNSFEIVFASTYALEHNGQNVVVTYSATLNEEAGINFDANTNNAKLSYTNDPNGGSNEIEDTTYTYTFGIDAKLYGSSEEAWNKITEELLKTGDKNVTMDGGTTYVDGPLSGATFTLTNDSTGKSYTAESSENGHLSFTGLDAGKYTLQETKAPDGYSLNDAQIPVEITATYNTDGTLNSYKIKVNNENTSTYTATYENKTVKNIVSSVSGETSDTYEIKNTKLSSLPSTGGIGTTIFTIGGCAIMIIAAALFFASRRKASK